MALPLLLSQSVAVPNTQRCEQIELALENVRHNPVQVAEPSVQVAPNASPDADAGPGLQTPRLRSQ